MTTTIVDGQAIQPRRWTTRVAVIAAATLVLSSGIALSILKPWAKPPPVAVERLAARVELAAGGVTLEEEGGSRTLLSGTPLPETATLQTAEGARALLRLGDGSRVYMDESTQIVVAEGIIVNKGRVWLDVPQLESGREPSVHQLGDHHVSLSDGGASLSFDGGAGSVYVAEGLAVVTGSDGRTEVDAGEQAELGDGQPKVSPVAFWQDWTGGMGDRSGAASGLVGGSGTLYAVDRSAEPGTPALPLSIQRQSVKVVVRDLVAETLVDQTFFNPSGKDVEGYYWFTIPENSQLVGFALETNGQLVEGEIVERNEANRKYGQATQRGNDPAMLEWVDARTVRARIYPVTALGTRRIVMRYQQVLSESEGKILYRYPLAGGAGSEAPTIEDFSLALDLGPLAETHDLATLSEARLEEDGRRVTMRRSGYTPRADFQLELTRRQDAAVDPIRLSLVEPGGDQARYAMLRYTPQLDFEAVIPRGEVVVVVDTSAAGASADYEARLSVAEALLRSLSDNDRFAVMTADVTTEVLHPADGLAEATPEAVSAALEKLGERSVGGATDLGSIFETALERVHGLEQPAVVYIGDGLATSGERGGDALVERLRRSMAGSRARLFTVGVGHHVDGPLLDRLARAGGGDSLRVERPQQAVSRALALSGALKTPTLTDLEVDLGEGLDDVFYSHSGKISRGQELVILARTHHDLPQEVTVRGRLGSQEVEVTHEIVRDTGLANQLVPRLWAGAYVERLLGDARGPEAVRGKILSLGLEYGIMTPYTSFLALESEAAYQQLGIVRRTRPHGGMRLTAWSTDLDHVAAPALRRPSTDPSEVLVGIVSAPLGCKSSDSSSGAADPSVAAPPKSQPAPVAEPQAVERLVADEAHDAAAANTPGAGGEIAYAEAEPPKAEEEEGERFGAANKVSAVKKAEPPPPPPRTKNAGAPTAASGKSDEQYRPAKRKPRAQELPPREPAFAVTRGLDLPCSDASARSLAHRRVLWGKRLRGASMAEAVQIYEASAGSCEIESWRDQRTFLDFLQARVATQDDARGLLAHFAPEPDAANYLARSLLRRLVDPTLVAAVHNAIYGEAVDWLAVDDEVLLATDLEGKLNVVREALARAPGDPAGERRALDLLVAGGRLRDAISRGNRLREQGLMTPELAQTLGEALVAAGDPGRAQRIFSEIVEFDPANASSRALLGDIFLRHGWYDRAYRQYEDLLELRAQDPVATLRLARAAAGAERTDEALRLLRKVASRDGRPGPDDPRRFARLHSATLLGLLHHGDLGSTKPPTDALERELRRLQLFEGATAWTFVLWQDLDAKLVLTGEGLRGTEAAGEAIRAADTGLVAVQGTLTDLGALRVRHDGGTHRPVEYRRITISFDGGRFTVDVDTGTATIDV